MNTKKIIAITGTIGSGKSTVANYLRQQGFVVLDCDKIAFEVSNFPHIVEQVGQLLGQEFVLGGKLDRPAIRKKIFSDQKLLNSYNDIFFGEIKSQLIKQLEPLCGVVFVEIPLISAFEFTWYQIWLVSAKPHQQISRVALRDSVSHENVEKILSVQTPHKTPTHIFDNSLDLPHLFKQIDKQLSSL